MDDSLLISGTFAECLCNIRETIDLVDKLGFTVHLDKSVFETCAKYCIFRICSKFC